jgi:uncharacterized membrane protein
MNERPSARTEGHGRRAARSQQLDYAEYRTSSSRDVGARRRSWSEQGSDGTAGEPTERPRLGWQVRSLGWLSIGLGVAGLMAPGRLARLTGRFDTRGHRRALRLIGARELLTGLAIVTRRRPNRWLWSRVVGDAIDLGLAFGTRGWSRGLRPRRQSMTLAALGAITAVDLVSSYRTMARNGVPSDEPEGEPRKETGPFRASITINRPPALVYTFWRRLENLPRFMTYLDSIEVIDERRSHWKAVAAGTAIEWDAEITQDVPNRAIAWESTGGPAKVAHSGTVRFSEAPGNRGTEVRLEMNVALPGGGPARAAARLLRRLPEQIALNDLHRLKQLIETGSIARSDASIHAGPHPAQPSPPAATGSPPSSADRQKAVSTAAGDPTITGERS